MRTSRAIYSSRNIVDDSRGRPISFLCSGGQSPNDDAAVRVKRCGKSAPPLQQWGGQGKPHTEQDQIGRKGAALAVHTCWLGASNLRVGR
jgi:hypothetical protein